MVAFCLPVEALASVTCSLILIQQSIAFFIFICIVFYMNILQIYVCLLLLKQDKQTDKKSVVFYLPKNNIYSKNLSIPYNKDLDKKNN